MGPGTEDSRKNPKFQNIAAGRKRKMKAAIITSSDKGYAGEREDVSGQVMEDILKEVGYEIMRKVILPDDRQMLADEMLRMCQDGADLIMTTGGTGFSQRDVTPEATRMVIEREARGITDAILFYSLSITPRAMLSRAIAGIRGETLIVNLPGSPKAVKEALDYILPSLKHGLEILKGLDSECARKE